MQYILPQTSCNGEVNEVHAVYTCVCVCVFALTSGVCDLLYHVEVDPNVVLHCSVRFWFLPGRPVALKTITFPPGVSCKQLVDPRSLNCSRYPAEQVDHLNNSEVKFSLVAMTLPTGLHLFLSPSCLMLKLCKIHVEVREENCVTLLWG